MIIKAVILFLALFAAFALLTGPGFRRFIYGLLGIGRHGGR